MREAAGRGSARTQSCGPRSHRGCMYFSLVWLQHDRRYDGGMPREVRSRAFVWCFYQRRTAKAGQRLRCFRARCGNMHHACWCRLIAEEINKTFEAFTKRLCVFFTNGVLDDAERCFPVNFLLPDLSLCVAVAPPLFAVCDALWRVDCCSLRCIFCLNLIIDPEIVLISETAGNVSSI